MRVDLESAFSSIRGEIDRKELQGLQIEAETDFVKLRLIAEQRDIWLGFEERKGYFLTFNKSETPSCYFSLEAAGRQIRSLVPMDTAKADEWGRLLTMLGTDHPDPGDVRQILDEVPITERGIDVLATIATIKSCRLAVDKMRGLVSRGNVLEAEYEAILSANPWMLGSQYRSVVRRQYKMGSGQIDLMLANAIGYVDIVELKRPEMTLLAENRRPNMTLPAENRHGVWRVSQELSAAIAQAKMYIRTLDENRRAIEDDLGFCSQSASRMYRSSVVIVAGRTPEGKEAKESLRGHNADPRLILLTYDDLLAIGEATVVLFERTVERKVERVIAGGS